MTNKGIKKYSIVIRADYCRTNGLTGSKLKTEGP
jgi:hypothetical protein